MRRLHSKTRTTLFVTILLLAGLQAWSIPPLPEKLYPLATNCIELAYQEEFKQAESEARKIIRHFPDHPAGYFFYAFVLDLRMTYFQSDELETEFYTNSNLAVSKGEERLEKSPDDFWTHFFVAGAKGVKGTYESRYGRWISAFRNGWQGVSAIKDLVKKYPDVKDLYFGLGTYDYWRSALTKQLWWMPGVEDRREVSIGMLRAAADSGVFVKQAAAYHLASILLNEKRYEEALKLNDALMAKYPRSLLFSWGRGRALLGLERYDEALALYQGVSGRLSGEAFKNNYNAVLCHYYLSKCYFGLKQHEQVKREIKAMFSYPLSEDTRKRMSDFFDDAMSMKKAEK